MYNGQPNYKVLAMELSRITRCASQKPQLMEAAQDAQGRIDRIMDTAPSGSGIDNGIKLLQGECWGKLKFQADYHHMNDGMYDGWTEHVVTVKPDMEFDIAITISGKDRNDIKDHLHERFDCWLKETYNGDVAKD